MGTPLWIRPKRMMYSLLLALILVACVFAKDDHARVFGPGKDFGSFEESGTLSSTSSTSSSSTSSSDEDRSRRAERDQRRIELAVQDALLADNPEPAFPQRAQFKSKSYQITYTTVKDSLPDEHWRGSLEPSVWSSCHCFLHRTSRWYVGTRAHSCTNHWFGQSQQFWCIVPRSS